MIKNERLHSINQCRRFLYLRIMTEKSITNPKNQLHLTEQFVAPASLQMEIICF